MSKNNIYITYLYNSGFIAETEKHLMIFDFCLGGIRCEYDKCNSFEK
mgnify:CR=1 FL=1